MKLSIYSLFDSAVKSFTQPFFLQSDAAAVRLFQDQVNRKDSITSNHPDQFTLMHVGSFDDATGCFDSIEPRSLGNGLQYKDVNSIHVGDPESLELLRKIHSVLVKG